MEARLRFVMSDGTTKDFEIAKFLQFDTTEPGTLLELRKLSSGAYSFVFHKSMVVEGANLERIEVLRGNQYKSVAKWLEGFEEDLLACFTKTRKCGIALCDDHRLLLVGLRCEQCKTVHQIGSNVLKVSDDGVQYRGLEGRGEYVKRTMEKLLTGVVKGRRGDKWEMDGTEHERGGEDCNCTTFGQECPECGGLMHMQPMYGGILYECEVCERLLSDPPIHPAAGASGSMLCGES